MPFSPALYNLTSVKSGPILWPDANLAPSQLRILATSFHFPMDSFHFPHLFLLFSLYLSTCQLFCIFNKVPWKRVSSWCTLFTNSWYLQNTCYVSIFLHAFILFLYYLHEVHTFISIVMVRKLKNQPTLYNVVQYIGFQPMTARLHRLCIILIHWKPFISGTPEMVLHYP